MKRKFLSVLLATVLLVALVACGNSAASGDPTEEQPPIESDVLESTPTDEAPEQSDESMGVFNVNATLDDTVLVDEDGVKITATGLTNTTYSVDLALTIENNSGKDLSFISGSLGYSCNSINGYMVDDGYLNCDVADGKKANDTISFGYDALMLYGIDEIADMEIGISMTDDDYNTAYTGPRQLKTSVAETHDYGADHYQETITSKAAMNTYGYEMVHFSQDTLYDQNGVKLLSSGILSNQNGEAALVLELENSTDSTVYLYTSNIAINGLLVNNSIWSSDAINPGRRRIVEIMLSSVLDAAHWSAYGLDQVGTVSLSLGQRNEDGADLVAETAVEIVVPGVTAAFDGTGTEVYNSGGLRLIAKSVQEDASDYSSDLYVLLLAENRSGRTLTIADSYDSLSVNGFMTDYSFYSQELPDGASAALVIKLWESSLQENQVAEVSDIREIEMSFEVREGYTTVDEPTVTISFE